MYRFSEDINFMIVYMTFGVMMTRTGHLKFNIHGNQEYIKGGERVSNGAYADSEHRWESNVTFCAAHMFKYLALDLHDRSPNYCADSVSWQN